MDVFWDWVWSRHANVLSWYNRPLFLLPLAWFAYRRSGWGIVVTVVALVSSMAWFPAPAQPDPASPRDVIDDPTLACVRIRAGL